MTFEWDPGKALVNLIKHGVTFDEAVTAFRDPLASVFPDDGHSILDKREILVGSSTYGRLLVVSFTERTYNSTRIISARTATPRERKSHEESCLD